MSAATQAFDAIVSAFEGLPLVVTAASDAERGGCLVGFASQCSIEPPRFCVWLSKQNRTYRLALSVETLAVHVLRFGDEDLARLFGAETGDEIDKFKDIEWQPGPSGCPVIRRLDWFTGSIVDRVDTGDHVAFVLAPTGGESKRSGHQPLSLRQIADIQAGHPIPEP